MKYLLILLISFSLAAQEKKPSDYDYVINNGGNFVSFMDESSGQITTASLVILLLSFAQDANMELANSPFGALFGITGVVATVGFLGGGTWYTSETSDEDNMTLAMEFKYLIVDSRAHIRNPEVMPISEQFLDISTRYNSKDLETISHTLEVANFINSIFQYSVKYEGVDLKDIDKRKVAKELESVIANPSEKNISLALVIFEPAWHFINAY